MTRSRFSLLGVLVAAIGLMAFFASAAQADPLAKWLVLKEPGVLLTEAEILALNTRFEVAPAGVENKTISLLSEIGTTKIDILCTGMELIDALLSGTGGIKEGATVKFTGCKFLSGGATGLEKEQPKCIPKTHGGLAGVVETLPVHALLKLHPLAGGETHHTLLILPDDPEKINKDVIAQLELGASCAFGEELPVVGHLALWDCEGNKKELEHKLSHLVTEFAPLTTLSLFTLRGKVGAKNASIDGSVLIRLNTDELWSGDPE